MTVEKVFLAALDQTDADARALYLEATCGEDAAFRRQVEGLLAAHFRSGEFLDTPAAEQIHAESSNDITITHLGNAVSADKIPYDETDGLHLLSPSIRPDSLGRIGHYEVLQILGKGGFGIVYRAFDDVLQRVVAIKMMAPQLAATSPARKRFLREARTSAAVRHENIVQVYEVAEQPLPYLAMEFIPGETLQQKLDRSGPLEVPDVLRIGKQIAEGLAAAHATDLIHRDIKPSNVLIEGGAQQKVKITDFGLARAADDASISQSGIIAGTPMYMAPEQALGQKLDQRADLFSLGSVLYQMAAGRPPFRANGTVAVLKRVADDTPRSIREIIPETPQWLCDIIAKLHAKSPEDRYQSAREVADVLADCETQLKANSRLKDFSRIPKTSEPGRSRKFLLRSVKAAMWSALFLLGMFAIFCATKAGTIIRGAQGRNEVIVSPAEGLTAFTVYQNGQPVTGLMEASGEQTLTLPEGEYSLKPVFAPGHALENWKYETAGWTEAFAIWAPEELFLRVRRGDKTKVQAVTKVLAEAPEARRPINVAAPDASPLPVSAPFDAVKAREHQNAWAKSLGVDVEAVNSLGMKMRLVPPGKFLMGSSIDEPGRDGNEAERVTVSINEPFRLAAHPVTVGQFREFVRAAQYVTEAEMGKGAEIRYPDNIWRNDPQANWLNPGYELSEDYPVTCLTWNDVQAFCKWLSKKENVKYVIPSEEQWEYACRSGTESPFFFGDDPRRCSEYGWIDFNSEMKAHSVGQLRANAWGLHDMIGNVWNITHGSAKFHYIRGGSWWDISNLARSASRWLHDGKAAAHIGFRVAVVGDNGLRLPRVPASDSDRKAAERVIALEGAAFLDGNMHEIRVVADLPPRKFKLTYAGLFRKPVSDADLEVFQGCNDLAKIDLYGCKQVTNSGMAHIKNCTNLNYINLAGTQVGDEGLAHFKDFQKLDFLVFDSTQVTDEGLAHFQNCTSLTWLQLCGLPRVTDAGLAAFKNCKNLKRLWLDGTAVGNAGLVHLLGMDQLVELKLAGTKVTAKGVEGLAKKLPNCRITWDGGVIEPRVGYAPLTDADVKRIAALPANEQVEEVRKELKKRNPEFDASKMQVNRADGFVADLTISGQGVTDISPIRAFSDLKSFTCGGPACRSDAAQRHEAHKSEIPYVRAGPGFDAADWHAAHQLAPARRPNCCESGTAEGYEAHRTDVEWHSGAGSCSVERHAAQLARSLPLP